VVRAIANEDTAAFSDRCEQVIDLGILIIGEQRRAMQQSQNDDNAMQSHCAALIPRVDSA
jgi:hypothetical protein